MPLFSRPIARIYVSELRTHLDALIVPVFTPDTAINIGDFGSFEDGQYVSRGNLADRGVKLDVEENPTEGFVFASSGKVRIEPSVQVPNPAGGDLVKTELVFTKAKAVVASFQAGVDRSVRDADRFGEQLLELWYGKQLRVDRMVVWSIRRATGGTVIVSEDGDNKLEVLADSAVLGPAGITLAGLSAGVTFGAEQKATWKMSSTTVPLISWMRLFKLHDYEARVVDSYRFEPGSKDLKAALAGKTPTSFTSDELLAQL